MRYIDYLTNCLSNSITYIDKAYGAIIDNNDCDATIYMIRPKKEEGIFNVYIGVTTGNIKTRLSQHVSELYRYMAGDGRMTKKIEWFMAMYKFNVEFDIYPIMKVPSKNKLHYIIEKLIIYRLDNSDIKIVNMDNSQYTNKKKK